MADDAMAEQCERVTSWTSVAVSVAFRDGQAWAEGAIDRGYPGAVNNSRLDSLPQHILSRLQREWERRAALLRRLNTEPETDECP